MRIFRARDTRCSSPLVVARRFASLWSGCGFALWPESRQHPTANNISLVLRSQPAGFRPTTAAASVENSPSVKISAAFSAQAVKPYAAEAVLHKRRYCQSPAPPTTDSLVQSAPLTSVEAQDDQLLPADAGSEEVLLTPCLITGPKLY